MQKKIFATYMIVVLISLLVSGILILDKVDDYLTEGIESRLMSNAKILQRVVQKQMAEGANKEEIQRFIMDTGSDLNSRITVIDIKGNVVADSDIRSLEIENHKSRPEVKNALKGEAGMSIRYSTSLKKNMMYVAVPIQRNNAITGVVRLSLPLVEIKQLSNSVLRIVFWTTLIGLIIAFIFSSLFSKKITKPLQDMAMAAGEIARGNYNMKIRTRENGEIKALANSFNIMTDSLQQTVRELTDRKRKIEVVLSSMTDNLIAVDHNCNVIMLNPSAEGFFKINEQDALNRHLLEIVRNQDLYEYINEVLINGQVVSKEFKIFKPEERVFRVNIAPILEENNCGAVAVIRDMTEFKKLEKARTEFVANISHELKTPLTSISGFIETLLDGAYKRPEDCLHFLEIIKQESDRMTRLINDLLYFSNLENPKTPMAKSKVDIIKMINKALNALQTAIDEKRHEVIVKKPDKAYVWASEDAVIQLLINLLDNAIKYTQPDGKIEVIVKEQSEYIAVSVADSGVGMSREEISRIFERFYRVDKSRSRDIKGTGLGLAVVKHLLKAQGGDISVKSELGKGSTFTFRLPKA